MLAYGLKPKKEGDENAETLREMDAMRTELAKLTQAPASATDDAAGAANKKRKREDDDDDEDAAARAAFDAIAAELSSKRVQISSLREPIAAYLATSAAFAPRDPIHAGFVAAAALSRARVYSIHLGRLEEYYDVVSVAADAKPGMPGGERAPRGARRGRDVQARGAESEGRGETRADAGAGAGVS